VSGVARVARSLAGVAAVAVLAVLVSVANRGPHHAAVHFWCGYTPARLTVGQWWTLVGSALLVVHLKLFGINTALLLGVVLPYAVREGSRRTLAVFFAGHVMATLTVAAVVLPLAVAGWGPAEVVRTQVDSGISAGVAAVAAAVAVSMRRRRWGVVLLGALAMFFAGELVTAHTLSEAEHLIALATGAVLGRRWRLSPAPRAALHRRFIASPAG
jgi:hypothetical protein